MRSLGAGCSTRHGRCSDPPLSHLGRGAARRVDQNVTYGQVSLSVASPRSEVLSRPCQHKQRLATLCNTNTGTLCPNSSILSRPCQQKQRLATLCNTTPVRSAPVRRDSATLVSTGNDWQHCATQPRCTLCPNSSRLDRPCHRHDRRGVPLREGTAGVLPSNNISIDGSACCGRVRAT